MKDYIPIKKTTMKQFADHARYLNNTEKGLSTNDMLDAAAKVGEDIEAQAELIGEILTALEGKAVSGGDSGGTSESSGATINFVQVKPSSNSTSISFTGLTAQPKMFAIMPMGNITLGTTRYVTGVISDGSLTAGTYGYRSGSSATSYYSASYFTWTYDNGTLTVTTNSSANGGNFASSATYVLIYAV